MAVFNTGKEPHRQHFYGNSINDAPLSAYKGDKFHEQTGDHLTYIFNGVIWELDESSVNIKEKGISVTDGTQVYQSYEKDPQGYGVKRVTIAAYPSFTLTHTKIEVSTTTTSVLPENLNRKYMSYKSIELEKLEPDSLYDNAHNEYIEQFIKGGVFQFIIYLILIIYSLNGNY